MRGLGKTGELLVCFKNKTKVTGRLIYILFRKMVKWRKKKRKRRKEVI